MFKSGYDEAADLSVSLSLSFLGGKV